MSRTMIIYWNWTITHRESSHQVAARDDRLWLRTLARDGPIYTQVHWMDMLDTVAMDQETVTLITGHNNCTISIAEPL